MPEPRRKVPDGGVEPGLNVDGSTIPNNRIVRRGTNTDDVRLATAASQAPRGVSMQAIPPSVTGDVQVAGRATIESGSALALGDRVGSDSVGRAVVVVNPGDFVIGTVETTASASGIIVEVALA